LDVSYFLILTGFKINSNTTSSPAFPWRWEGAKPEFPLSFPGEGWGEV